VPDDEINKMTLRNAMRCYHWDVRTSRSRPLSARYAGGRGPTCPFRPLRHEHGGASFADFAASAKKLTGNKD
jgi:hypothetical protein